MSAVRQVGPDYVKLDDELRRVGPYTPLLLNDFAWYPASDFYKRHRFQRSLAVSQDVQLFSYSAGNYTGTLTFIWALPKQSQDRSSIRSIEAHRACEARIPVFHTRAMRKEFFSRYANLSRLPPAVLRDMYRFLTGDSSKASDARTKAVDARFAQLLALGDAELVYDLREELTGARDRFDVFWDHAARYLDGSLVPNDRRHGDIGFLPVIISIRDFRAEVTSLCPAGTSVPSEEWIR